MNGENGRKKKKKKPGQNKETKTEQYFPKTETNLKF